jgi:phage terminase large subunit
MTNIKIEWAQQQRQMVFLRACGLSHPWDSGRPKPPQAQVIGYGGAAGGGKSDALLVCGIVAGLSFPGINIGYFRRTYSQLDGPGGAIMRSQELMSGWARWNGSLRRWTLPTGSILQFCYCDKETDVYNYQSQQFDIILIDEATQFARFQVRYLMTRNRATKSNVIPFTAMATNPGNVGHVWFKSDFIDPGSPEVVHDVEVEPGVFEQHIFIPSKLSDNQILEQRDPGYRRRLEAQDEATRKQLLDGDWDIFAGQYFSCWRRELHVVRPFEIPEWWRRFRSLDYGLDCTACYDWAVDQSGTCYITKELYKPDLTLSLAAKEILEWSNPAVSYAYTVASPDLWNRRQSNPNKPETGISGVEIMQQAGLRGLTKADNRRIPGWEALHEFLLPQPDERDEMSPRLIIFENCINLIRTLPALIRDEHNPNDVSDKCEDHGPESIRYGIMSRPALSAIPKPPIPGSGRRDFHSRLKQREQKRDVASSVTGY